MPAPRTPRRPFPDSAAFWTLLIRFSFALPLCTVGSIDIPPRQAGGGFRSSMAESTISINLADRDEAVLLFGHRDQFLRMIREALQVRVVARGDTIQI